MKDKLTINELAPYLPYGLKVQYYNEERGQNIICNIEQIHIPDELTVMDAYNEWDVCIHEIKPLLLPLGELRKLKIGEINILDYMSKREIDRIINTGINHPSQNLFSIDYGHVVGLFKLHFDVFGLIEKGTALNKLDYEG